MKKLRKLLLIIILIFVVVWGLSVAKCEYLTHQYEDKYRDIVEEFSVGDGYYKILETDWAYTRIYCVVDNEHNKVGVELLVDNPGEKIYTYRTIWSSTGNADGVLWPYLWINRK